MDLPTRSSRLATTINMAGSQGNKWIQIAFYRQASKMVKTKKFRVPQLASKDSDNVGAKRTSIFSNAPAKKVSMGIDNKEPCQPQPLGLGSAQSAPNCFYTLAPQRRCG